MINDYFINLYHKAYSLNTKNILNLLKFNKKAKFLDLVCGDGKFTLELAKHIGTKEIFGVEIADKGIKSAKKKGVKVGKFNLNNKFNFNNNFFDVIHANRVIEHLYKSDNFISEIFRILKPGGYVVISTENASS